MRHAIVVFRVSDSFRHAHLLLSVALLQKDVNDICHAVSGIDFNNVGTVLLQLLLFQDAERINHTCAYSPVLAVGCDLCFHIVVDLFENRPAYL